MNEISIIGKNEESAEIRINGRYAGLLKMFLYRPGNDFFYNPLPCQLKLVKADGDDMEIIWTREDEGLVVTSAFRRHSSGMTGTLSAAGNGKVIVKLVWQLPEAADCFPFTPAFMYGLNEGGASKWATYPQLRGTKESDFGKPWISDEWLIRADRSSHCLTSIITNDFTAALGGRDVCRYIDGTVAEKNGLGIGASDSRQQISFSLGFMNVPYTYSTVIGRNFISRPEGYINLDNGDVSSPFFMFLFEEQSRFTAASRLMRESYVLFDDKVGDGGGIMEAVDAISQAIMDYAYCEDARNFYCTIPDDRCIAVKKPTFESGWSGGVRTAYPLLLAGHQCKKDDWINRARSVCSNIADNSVSPRSGLFNENYDISANKWNARGWWYHSLEKPGHSGYLNGQACHYLLRCYLCEKESGNEYANWLDAAKRVLDKIVSEQGSDGRFGYTYDEKTGKILDGDGFAGCWFVPALAYLYGITKDERYLQSAEKAMDFYRTFVERFELWGCPHDVFKSPDEEGVLAWIEAARILHQLTGAKQFLNDLVMGLEYEFSWKFAYNVVNEVEPLKSLEWSSRGGSVTSVNNSHIHPMGSAVTNSLLYAAEITGDDYLWSRLKDTLRWTLTIYLHSDGEYDWGRRGLINERFCYTDSLLNERYPDGSPAATWFTGHNWASGAALEGLVGEVYLKGDILLK